MFLHVKLIEQGTRAPLCGEAHIVSAKRSNLAGGKIFGTPWRLRFCAPCWQSGWWEKMKVTGVVRFCLVTRLSHFRQADWAWKCLCESALYRFNDYMAKKPKQANKKNSGNKNNKFNKVTESNGSEGGGSWQVLPGLQLAYTPQVQVQLHKYTIRHDDCYSTTVSTPHFCGFEGGIHIPKLSIYIHIYIYLILFN